MAEMRPEDGAAYAPHLRHCCQRFLRSRRAFVGDARGTLGLEGRAVPDGAGCPGGRVSRPRARPRVTRDVPGLPPLGCKAPGGCAPPPTRRP